MRKIDKELQEGDVVRLRGDILVGDWRHESRVGWIDDMQDLADEKLVVSRINYRRDNEISFGIEHHNHNLSRYGYSSTWFDYAEILEGAVEL